MICTVSLSQWDYATKWHPERLPVLVDYLATVGIDPPPPGEDDERKAWFDRKHNLNIVDLAERGLPFSVQESNNLKGSFEGQIASYLQRIHEKIAGVKSGGAPSRETHLHVESATDSWLHAVNDVMVQEDCCTDDLRRLIDEGWRIVAVCPQARNRRPDYVLGRVKTADVTVEVR